ncbi:hypothetical protein H327_05460 [Vibrio parahaemolyticus 3324]|nr:hypothetical protein [Vibrio sp. Vb0587]AYF15010.1 hypothetical protein FORC72_1279 [Vibrio parahaemolyticus]KIS88626.1 hypothetical protein H321_05455 [Vibrio parahaemolyticus 97-10290]KIS92742.1 hypothetical protein H338_05435 [Vibrio parahaemolyticus EN9701173]KIS96538.1 hypothetical protein H333_05420 [Vibrio parahaemolyticus 12315]KIT03230.1 hypothetical protein H324_05415 [Vibrio parahaemolyticus 846]KIT05413.1 hypothetical protein H327_05460 [Vibrio parahaemolyticus 3324]KIT10781.1
MRALLMLSVLLAGGCTSYHVEQNSRNGMASCGEKGSSGNIILKKECKIEVDPKAGK